MMERLLLVTRQIHRWVLLLNNFEILSMNMLQDVESLTAQELIDVPTNQNTLNKLLLVLG